MGQYGQQGATPAILGAFEGICSEINERYDKSKATNDYIDGKIVELASGQVAGYAVQNNQMENQQDFYSANRSKNGSNNSHRQGSEKFSDDRLAAYQQQQMMQQAMDGLSK